MRPRSRRAPSACGNHVPPLPQQRLQRVAAARPARRLGALHGRGLVNIWQQLWPGWPPAPAASPAAHLHVGVYFSAAAAAAIGRWIVRPARIGCGRCGRAAGHEPATARYWPASQATAHVVVFLLLLLLLFVEIGRPAAPATAAAAAAAAAAAFFVLALLTTGQSTAEPAVAETKQLGARPGLGLWW